VTAILIAAAVGLAVTLLGTPVAIRLFRVRGWGQRIREDGPHTHLEKMGTPTMGGLVILGGMVAGYLAARFAFDRFTAAGLTVLSATLAFGLLGFVDDYIKVRRQRSLGLGKAAKFVGQAGIAILFGLAAVRLVDDLHADAISELSFTRGLGLDLGLFFFAWAFLLLAATANAVNLTDGLDGLASGSSAMVLAAYVIVSFWQFRHSCQVVEPACYPIQVQSAQDLAIVASGGMGAVAGFLWWNAAPARIFMGDTGSLALGGLVGALAIMTSTQLLLVVLGGLFVLETASVILQVFTFRLFRRRVFRMAPIHHHFELMGWPEFTVIVRFWVLCGLAVATGLGIFYADFLARGGID
jgi:phospho-N-acetylmuramoyl-pentapeptide-transferase